MINTEEHTLITQLKNKESNAFTQIVTLYSSQMYLTSYKFLNNEADSKDCVQQAFIQVLKHIENFREDAYLSTWLHRITVNCALMMLRSAKKGQTLPLESFQQRYNEFGERTVFSDNQHTNIASLVEQQQKQQSVQQLILLLPEKFCNLIQLRDIQELSTKETADILQMSVAAVKTQLHRARQCLKALLEVHKITE